MLAVDWSGRRSGEQRHLWMAEAIDGALVGLEAGRTRAAARSSISSGAPRPTPRSWWGSTSRSRCPRGSSTNAGYRSAPELWAAATRDGERWLRSSARPRSGGARPPAPRPVTEHFRQTEATDRRGRRHPPEVDVPDRRRGQRRHRVGARVPGAGSPAGRRASRSGRSTYPARPPVVVEIYPACAHGRGGEVGSVGAASRHLDRHHPGLEPRLPRPRDRERGRVRRRGVGAGDVAPRAGAPRPARASTIPIVRREGWVWTDIAVRSRRRRRPLQAA